MSVGIYGTQKLATIDVAKDVDIYYHYRPDRNGVDPTYKETFKKLANPSEMLSPSKFEKTTEPVKDILNGMFTLNLPLRIFNKKGVYTILITPRVYYTKIVDAPAVLNAFPDIRGIVLGTSVDGLTRSELDNNQLTGWRVDYYNADGSQRNFFRIITSNNWCEPISSNTSSSSQKSISYRFNDNSNILFCTVSPSTAVSIRASVLPYIGSTSEQISLTNTKFNSQVIEVEFIEDDFSTLATAISGSSALNLDKGILTKYNKDHEIIQQMDIIQSKDAYTGKPIYNLQIIRENSVERSEAWNLVMPTK